MASILAVDDEVGILDMIQSILCNWDYQPGRD